MTAAHDDGQTIEWPEIRRGGRGNKKERTGERRIQSLIMSTTRYICSLTIKRRIQWGEVRPTSEFKV